MADILRLATIYGRQNLKEFHHYDGQPADKQWVLPPAGYPDCGFCADVATTRGIS